MAYRRDDYQQPTQRPHTSHGYRDDRYTSRQQRGYGGHQSYLPEALAPTHLASFQDEMNKIMEENKALKKKCEAYKEDAKNFRSRYESLISDRLSTPSVDSENLSDDLRPSLVAEKWRYLKDQLFFQAYFDLHDILRDKPRAWHLLLTICKNAYKICRAESSDFNKGLKDRLFDPIAQKNTAEIGDVIKRGVERCLQEELGDRERRKLAESLQERYLRACQAILEDTQRQAVGEIKRFRKLAVKKQDRPEVLYALFPEEMRHHQQIRDICAEFAQESLVLCRAMMLQEPTMHLDFDLDPGSDFRFREFDVHDGEQGQESLVVDKLLLPALFRHRGGPMLSKGLATAQKKPLERPHTVGPHESRQRRRDQQQDTQSTIPASIHHPLDTSNATHSSIHASDPHQQDTQSAIHAPIHRQPDTQSAFHSSVYHQQDSNSGDGRSTMDEDRWVGGSESREQGVSERVQRSSGPGSSTSSSPALDDFFGGKAAETKARGTDGNDRATSTFNINYSEHTATGQTAKPRPETANPRVGHTETWK